MSPQNSRPKILMIEDDAYFRKLYKNKLSSVGFNFIEATNGPEGLNKAVTERPDLIILDLLLPQESGFGVLAKLKKNKATKNIPIIVLSILERKVDINRALNLGVQDYFVKEQITSDVVLNKIKEILNPK